MNPDFPVLNLIINGLPSKLEENKKNVKIKYGVLNLIINGLPSKRNHLIKKS